MSGVFAETQQAGDYTVEVTAARAGEDLGTAKARFLVYEQDLELDNAAADPTPAGQPGQSERAGGGPAVGAGGTAGTARRDQAAAAGAAGRARSERDSLGYLAVFCVVRQRALRRLVSAQEVGVGVTVGRASVLCSDAGRRSTNAGECDVGKEDHNRLCGATNLIVELPPTARSTNSGAAAWP